MGKIQIKDFILGKTDAYNEFLSFGKDICKHLFFEFPNIDINSLLEGKVYYICGEKGSGKTMLLKYIETILHDKEEPDLKKMWMMSKEILLNGQVQQSTMKEPVPKKRSIGFSL